MKNIGVGVIGCGFVGRGAHVPGIAAIEGATLAAVADPDEKRLGKAVKKHGAKAGYQDYAELIADPAVDAVIVSVPTPMHAKVAIAAMEAGKHVLCEMPLAANLGEVDDMIEASNKAGVYLMPGLTFRFTPNFVKLKQLIAAGEIGKPTALLYREFIPAKALAGQWPVGAWVWDVEKSGGPLYTLAVWSIDLVRWLLDTEITSVRSSTNYYKLEQFGGTLGYDSSAALQLENGISTCLQFSGSVCESAAGSSLEVIGDSTSVVSALNHDIVRLQGEDPIKTEWNVEGRGPKMWGHQQQDEYFVSCIRDGNTPSITPEDGRKAMEIAVEIAKSNQ